MRQISRIIVYGLLTTLLACKGDKTVETDNFLIPDPRFVDYDTSDTNINHAIKKVRDYLTDKESDTNINDFYLDNLYLIKNTIIIMIKFVDYYKTWRALEEDEKRQKELEDRGDTLIQISLPPTGNWSGRDTTILYLTPKDSIIDILY